MIKCSLTKLGRAGWENIWLSVMAYGPRAKYFPIRPPHFDNKYIILLIRNYRIRNYRSRNYFVSAIAFLRRKHK